MKILTKEEFINADNQGKRSVKTITGSINDMHLFYANNKGRGNDNLTICIVKKGTERAINTRLQSGVIYMYRKTAWHGIPNLKKDDLDRI